MALHLIPEDYKGVWQCECCGRFSKPHSLNFFSSLQNLSFLGSSFPLYFDFLKMAFIFIALVLFISGIYNLSTNNSISVCIKQDTVDQISDSYEQSIKNNQNPTFTEIQCQYNWITQFSLGNKGNDKQGLFTQEIVNLCTIFALILFMHYIVKRQRTIQAQSDNDAHQPHSFTILVSNIPTKLNTQQNNFEYALKVSFNKNAQINLVLSKNQEYQQILWPISKLVLERMFVKILLKIINLIRIININQLITVVQQLKLLFSLIKEFIENQVLLKDIHGQKLDLAGTIEKITFSFNIDNLVQLEQKLKDLMKFKQEEINTSGIGSQEVKKIELAIQKVEEDIFVLKQNYTQNRTQQFMSKFFSGQAFITFKYEHIAYKFLEAVNRKTGFLEKQEIIFHNQRLGFQVNLSLQPITEAPKPDDIQWCEMYESEQKENIIAFFFKKIGFFIAIGLGIAAFVIIVKYAYLQRTDYNKQYASRETVIDIHLIGVGLAIILYAVNVNIYLVLQFISYFKSKTRRASFVTNMTIIIQFIITTIMPFAIFAVETKGQSLYSMLYNPTGLSILETYIFVTQTIIPVILCAIDIPYYLRLFYRSKVNTDRKSEKLNQEELGKLFENPEFDMPYHYSQIMRTIYQTMFFAPMIPMCIVWTLAFMFFYYIITKFQLIYRRTVINSYGPSLCYSILLHLPISLVIFSLSSYCFHRINDPREEYKLIPSIISISITAFNFLFIPLFIANAKIFEIPVNSSQSLNTNKRYKDLKNSFKTEYDKENPALNLSLLDANERSDESRVRMKQQEYDRSDTQQVCFPNKYSSNNNNEQYQSAYKSNNQAIKGNPSNTNILDYKLAERTMNFGNANDQKLQSQSILSQSKPITALGIEQQKIENKFLQQLQQSQFQANVLGDANINNSDQENNTQAMISQIGQQLSLLKYTTQPNRDYLNMQVNRNKQLMNWINDYQVNYTRNNSQLSYKSEFLTINQLRIQLDQIQSNLINQIINLDQQNSQY